MLKIFLDICKILLVFLFCQFIAGGIISIPSIRQLPIGILTFWTSLLAYLITTIYCIKTQKLTLNKDSFSYTNKIFYAIGFVALFCLIFILDYISAIANVKDLYEPLFLEVCSSPWGLISTTLFAAFFEELIFRGAIMGTLLKKVSAPLAILIASLIFGCIHFNPIQILGGVIIGLFLGWCFYKTKSLLPGILFHLTNNALSAFFIYKYHGECTDFSYFFSNPKLHLLIVFLCLVVGCFCFYLLNTKILSKSIKRSN